jgi:AmmeMemoRadiSam system protein B/AmmeMemoRadiSam system protein A
MRPPLGRQGTARKEDIQGLSAGPVRVQLRPFRDLVAFLRGGRYIADVLLRSAHPSGVSAVARIIQTLVALLLLVSPFHESPRQPPGTDRSPAVAGTFYPSVPEDLRRTLETLFANAAPNAHFHNIAALIVPHAGYLYSGAVAASGFNQIDSRESYDNVIVIGPSHYVGFEGAAVYTAGNFRTPLGPVEVNTAIGKALIASSTLFSDRTDAQSREHSVEVELPFLQLIMGQHLKIVPIVLGANSPEISRRIADALRPYFNRHNLFVISSDFSHYPPYQDAIRTDSITAAAILTNSPDAFVRALVQNDHAGTPGLVTSMCGWSAALTLLSMTSRESDLRWAAVQYRNSGDSPAGEKNRVVGYWALCAYRQADDPPENADSLSEKDRAQLLAIARETLEQSVRNGTIPDISPLTVPAALRAPRGAFVTLTRERKLRGCIGRFEPREPLYKVVQEMAVAAASEDYRFRPVDRTELGSIRIEISVLTPMRKIHSLDEFDPAVHGIYIRKGGRSGTFLPQVAKETGWTREELLGHCAQDKAGIGWDGWKDAELYVYEALVFGE